MNEDSNLPFQEVPIHQVRMSRYFPPINSLEIRIYQMNRTFELPCHDYLVDGTPDVGERLKVFHKVLCKEVDELLDVTCPESGQVNMVSVADCLGDIVVYVFSEARRMGIPLSQVVHLILDSQESKLVNGRRVMAEDGSKFIKGPNYVPPEPDIFNLFYSIDVQPMVDPISCLNNIRTQMINTVYNTAPKTFDDTTAHYENGVLDVALAVLREIPE